MGGGGGACWAEKSRSQFLWLIHLWLLMCRNGEDEQKTNDAHDRMGFAQPALGERFTGDAAITITRF